MPGIEAQGFRLHFRGQAAYRYQPFVPFYGIGGIDAQTGYDPAKSADYYYMYQSSGPSILGSLAVRLMSQEDGAPFDVELFGGLQCEYASITKSPKLPSDGGTPALFAIRPTGYEGGTVNAIQAGALLDSRDYALNPRSGVYIEFAGEQNPKLSLDGFSYQRLTSVFCVYYSPFSFLPAFTFANRLMADALFGQPPFFVLGRFGGTWPHDGIGSADTLRGIPLHRYSGAYKFVNSTELRFRWLDFPVSVPGFEDMWHVENILFCDIGNAWSDADFAAAGVHFTYGIGLKLIRGEDSIYSFDFSFWNLAFSGVYIGFGQQF